LKLIFFVLSFIGTPPRNSVTYTTQNNICSTCFSTDSKSKIIQMKYILFRPRNTLSECLYHGDLKEPKF
jgi:hypothetical protein